MEGRGPRGARMETEARTPSFYPQKGRGHLSPSGDQCGGPSTLSPAPLSLALLAEPPSALQHPDPSPLSQGPGHLAAHGLGCPHQLTAQQWRQLCGCRPAECLQLQDGHAGLPPSHAHSQPVGLQEHHREAAGGRGAVAGLLLDGPVLGVSFLDCPFPPRGSWLACPILGAARGRGSVPGLALTKGAGTPLARDSTFVFLSHPYIVSLASRWGVVGHCPPVAED